jgi:hypothetical protein
MLDTQTTPPSLARWSPTDPLLPIVVLLVMELESCPRQSKSGQVEEWAENGPTKGGREVLQSRQRSVWDLCGVRNCLWASHLGSRVRDHANETHDLGQKPSPHGLILPTAAICPLFPPPSLSLPSSFFRTTCPPPPLHLPPSPQSLRNLQKSSQRAFQRHAHARLKVSTPFISLPPLLPDSLSPALPSLPTD